jgi:hypothetical protein
MNTSSRYWYLVFGLFLGAGLGLVFTWVISPVRYVDAAPYSLKSEHKDAYRVLITTAFAASGDLGRAEARLGLLREADPVRVLTVQAQRGLGGGGSYQEARALALLATILEQRAGIQAPTTSSLGNQPGQKDTGSPESSTSEETPASTASGASYKLTKFEQVCDPEQDKALLQVETYDTQEHPVVGVRVLVTWAEGQAIFYTGPEAERKPGESGFRLVPGVQYMLYVGSGTQATDPFQVAECTRLDRTVYPGGWFAVFEQE